MTNKPEFLIIGGQKCATTWLYKCLKEHPQLYLPPYKRDIDHIASELYLKRGIDHYFDNFKDARENQKIVDISVEYLFNRICAEIVNQYLPNTKLIVSLRDPIDRAISAYFWYLRKGYIPDLPINKGMKLIIKQKSGQINLEVDEIYKSILERGFYDVQINRYLKFFDKKNFLFILYDHISENPEEVVARVFQFLEVSNNFKPSNITSKPLANTYFKPILWLERRYPGSLSGPSFGARLFSKIADASNQFIIKMGFQSQKPKLHEQIRVELQTIYRPHIQELLNILSNANLIGEAYLPNLLERWS
ncbi:MAG: sulfotransferase domain-containing protein [bacterium]